MSEVAPPGPYALHQSWRLSQQAFLLYGMTLILTSEAPFPSGNLLPIQTEQANQKALGFIPLAYRATLWRSEPLQHNYRAGAG